MKVDKTENGEGCSYETNTEIYYYLNGECIVHFEINDIFTEHDYEYRYEFEGEVNCENGVIVYVSCKNCSYSYTSNSYYHSTRTLNYVDFADYGSCDGNGYIDDKNIELFKRKTVEAGFKGLHLQFVHWRNRIFNWLKEIINSMEDLTKVL